MSVASDSSNRSSGTFNAPSLSLSTNRSLSVTTASIVASVLTTVAFSVGYQMATYYTKRRLFQQMYNSTSGCILPQEMATSTAAPHGTIPAPRRFGACIQLQRDKYLEYRTLHDHVWDHVQQRLYDSHIRNFTIYYHPETSTLYQHFEWIGHWYAVPDATSHPPTHNSTAFSLSVEDEQALLDADLYAIAHDPITREWWKLCEPCQQPFAQWYQQPPPAPAPGSHHATNDADSKSVSFLLPSEGNTSGDWWAPMECVCQTGHYPVAYTLHTSDPDFVTLNHDSTTSTAIAPHPP